MKAERTRKSIVPTDNAKQEIALFESAIPRKYPRLTSGIDPRSEWLVSGKTRDYWFSSPSFTLPRPLRHGGWLTLSQCTINNVRTQPTQSVLAALLSAEHSPRAAMP